MGVLPITRHPPPARRGRVAAIATCAVCVVGAPASAQPERPTSSGPTVVWSAPAGCPASEDVAARIARRVPARSAGDDATETARVEVRATSEGYTADVRLGEARRTLTAPTCEDAAEAVAVVIALARGGRAEPEPEATPPPEPPAPRDAPPRPRPVGAAGAPPGPRLQGRVAVLGALDTASLPNLAAGATAHVALHRGAFGGGLALSAFVPNTATFGARGEARIGLVDALVLGCASPRLAGPDEAGRAGHLAAGACAGGGVGVLFGTSDGVSTPESGAGPRPELAGLGRVTAGLGGGFALRGELGVVVDPVRFPFRVANVGDVFRPPAASARIGLGLEATLW